MNLRIVPIIATLALVPLAGCFGGSSNVDAFEPGTRFSETGRTIHVRMWVADLFAQEVYPGFQANLWAFCAEPVDPADAVSAAAIEPWAAPPGAGQTDSFGNAYDERCSVPGPTLRVQQGDKVIVEFQNDHFHCHTIHWHGQFVPMEADGSPGVSQDSTCQGESYTYEFVAKRAGTLWYHCHVDTQFHVMQGLFGTIIVEPQDRSLEPEDIDREYVLVLSTLKRGLVETVPGDTNPHDDHGALCGGTSGTRGCKNPAVDVTPDTYLLNGMSYPYTMHHVGEEIPLGDGSVRMTGTQVFLKEGERVRLRLVNAGETVETIHPHGHDMYVTHRDGNPLPEAARLYVDTLTIGPAERYDVVLEGNNPGAWMMHTHVASHETNDGQSPGGMHTMIVYEGFEDQMHAFQAELPGGRPYAPPVNTPEDFLGSSRLQLGSGADTRDEWSFPVGQDMPCAVKTITVSAQAQSMASRLGAGLPTSGVRVQVNDADGNEVASFQLSDTEPHGEWTWRRDVNAKPDHIEITKAGDYTMVATGASTLDAEVDVSAFVDYDDDEGELLEERACGYGPGGHGH